MELETQDTSWIESRTTKGNAMIEAKKKVRPITTLALQPEADAKVMALYRALADIFEHSWRFELAHYLDGLPSIHIEVQPPYDDLFIYDDRVFACVEKHMPSGYFFDGTSHASQSNEDGSGDRDYFVCPKKKTQ